MVMYLQEQKKVSIVYQNLASGPKYPMNGRDNHKSGCWMPSMATDPIGEGKGTRKP